MPTIPYFDTTTAAPLAPIQAPACAASTDAQLTDGLTRRFQHFASLAHNLALACRDRVRT